MSNVLLVIEGNESLNLVSNLLARMRVRDLIDAGWQDDEIVDDLARAAGKAHPLSIRDRHRFERVIAQVRGEQPRASTHGPNPKDLVTLEKVLEARAELDAKGLPSGSRSIAKVLGCHKSTVDRRLATRATP